MVEQTIGFLSIVSTICFSDMCVISTADMYFVVLIKSIRAGAFGKNQSYPTIRDTLSA